MKIIQSILTKNPCFTAGKKIAVKGLMLHSVGCSQPSAEVFVKKWNSPEQSRACVHAFIDGNTGIVYQTLPWNHRAWHCGGTANNTHIGVEMCEPSCIHYTGGASFTCENKEEAMKVVSRTYKTAVELFASLCKQYGLNPLEKGVIYSHNEGHKNGLASGHLDPEHLWNGVGSGYTMDKFRQDVHEAMNQALTIDQIMELQMQEKNPDKQKEQEGGTVPPKNIQPGDIISLAPNATYYDGREMPYWVKTDKWIVKSISGDRVVIDENISKSKAICSPVNILYVNK